MAHALPAADLLTAWEGGANTHAAGRARQMLRVAEPDLDDADLDRMMLGQRDLRLLGIYRATFGNLLRAQGRCPDCGEQVALDIDADQVTFSGREPADEPRLLELTVGHLRVQARPPDGALVLAAAGAGSVEAARDLLVETCVVAVYAGDTRLDDAGRHRLDDAVVAAVGDAIADADPQSEIRLDLVCALCASPWSATLDIATFLWAAVVGEGRRVVEQVHALAHAYGWSEAESLRLSNWRRQVYIERALDA